MHRPLTSKTVLPEIESMHEIVDVRSIFSTSSMAGGYVSQLAARWIDIKTNDDMLANELRKVAVLFVGLHSFADSDEMTLDLNLINEVYNAMSGITQRLNGAVRDMLFEDKGCTFIAVFGALT
jgi:hypothetical protein